MFKIFQHIFNVSIIFISQKYGSKLLLFYRVESEEQKINNITLMLSSTM